MRQDDGAVLLGSYDSLRASISVLYVDPSDDRQRVLTAILTQDKLGRKQVVLVLPEHNKAFQRPADFDGLKNMRRGLKTEIVFVATGSPAEFARQRRFPTYSSLESFAQSLKTEALINGPPKRGIFGFIRKPKQAAVNSMSVVSSSHVENEPTIPYPVNAPVAVSPKTDGGGNRDVMDESTDSNAAALSMAGLVAGVGLGSLADNRSASSTPGNNGADSYVQSPPVTGSQVDENASFGRTPGQLAKQPKSASPRGEQSKTGSGIITLPPAAPLAAIAAGSPMQSSESDSASPGQRGDSGKMGAAGAGAAMASRTAPGVGSGPPPGGSSPGGPGGGGGGVGGSGRRTRLLLAILLVALTVLLIAGIAVAALVSNTTITATVTITPASKDLANTYVITAVTGHPDPSKRQVQARILTYTSPTQMQTANATGSIPGRQATGQLTFLNNSNTTITCPSKTLVGTSGVAVSFNGPVTVPAVPGFATLTGFAVNAGTAGNIKALDINQSFCATGIRVKNGAFSGGRNAVPNTVIQQSDINGAANAIVLALTPGAQAALQKQVQPNEQVVPNTFQCNKSTFIADHKAGDIAKTVTVTVAITCKEEVYDQQAALTMAENLLKTAASKDPGPAYALTGNIVTAVTQASVVDTHGTVSLIVSAQGVWVYQFSDAVKQDFKNHIANMSKQDAEKYLLSQPGVIGAKIDISSGNTLPDASHITINIQPVPGATGTPTVTPGSPTSTASPTPKPPPISPTPGLGGS